MRFSDFELKKINSFLEKNLLSYKWYSHYIILYDKKNPIISIYKSDDYYYDIASVKCQHPYYRCDQLLDLLETLKIIIDNNFKVTESVKITKDEYYSSTDIYKFSDYESDKIQSFFDKYKLSCSLYGHYITVCELLCPGKVIFNIYKSEDDYYDISSFIKYPNYYKCDQLSDLLETLKILLDSEPFKQT
jgi:hypothetical protein